MSGVRSQGGGRAFVWSLILLCGVFWPRNTECQTTSAGLRAASAIAYDAAGNLYIADAASNQIFKATLAGDLVVVAGTGVQGLHGDGGPAISAELNGPQGLAVAPDGTLYLADTGNERVRAIGADGTILTVAGTGHAGFSGDGGPATAASLRRPTALAVEASGALLVCDTGNHRLRLLVGQQITTVAGSGVQGSLGDGGPATAAALDSPEGVAVAGDGRVFIADTHNQRIRVIGNDGVLRAFAGTGLQGFAGDGGPPSQAAFSSPRGLALNAAGDLLVADAQNLRIRSISPSGVIMTLAGSGVEGASTDGGLALAAAMRAPAGVAVSPFGYLTFADRANRTVRELAGSQALFQPAALASGRRSSVNAPSSATQTYGQGILVASVQGSVGVPQGGVMVTEGTSHVSTMALTGGAAILDLSTLAAGPHTLALRYSGDGLNPGAAGGGVLVAVAPAPITAIASPATVTYGANLPLISGTLSGVLPQDQGRVGANFSVSGDGLLPVGSYPITATLTGSQAPNYSLSLAIGSGRMTVVKAKSGTTLEAAVQGFTGVPLQLTATVLSTTRGQPTGTVQFLDGSAVVGTAALQGGSARATYASPPQGVRQLSVQFLGDDNFLPSSSLAAPVTVAALPDFNLTSNAAPTAQTVAGGAATFTFVVGAQPGPFTGAVSLSIAGLPAGATASFSPPQVVPGTGVVAVTLSMQTAAASQLSVSSAAQWPNTGRVTLALLGVAAFGSRWCRARRRWLALLGSVLLLTGCGARNVGEGIGGVLAQSYSLQVTGTATNLVGAVVSHFMPLTLTIQP